ncbi:hypothetical protein [Raoultibacter phocaeensis]|uniref:hypothetical protein n=1 Tax=Raoultibacter phocaeensis TaxID=2479841 RepID=UPI0011181E24|nr:hypothetical protein [Raoultibacter phocaeensis]
MRRAGTTLAILCTLGLVGIGAAMPHIATHALDRELEQRTTERISSSPSFAYGDAPDLIGAMELFASAGSLITLSEGVHMTEDEARAATEAILAHLQPSPHPSAERFASPLLVTDADEAGLSGVYWICTWQNSSEMTESIVLDDATGDAVAFELNTGTSTLAHTEEGLPESVELVLEYLRQCETVDTAEVNAIAPGTYLSEYAIALGTTAHDTRTPFEAPLYVSDDRISFNNGWHTDAVAMSS